LEKSPLNIVWLKRDLRTQDHVPLQLAEQAGIPYLIIFIFEPEMMAYADTSLRHLQFQYHSILQMNNRLEAYSMLVNLFQAEATEVFAYLNEKYAIQTIFSYQETGINLTYARDLVLQKQFKEQTITWKEEQSRLGQTLV
jgi:deoxyribodipyrimidine photo-lyase